MVKKHSGFWTQEKDDQLIAMIKAGNSRAAIAEHFGRGGQTISLRTSYLRKTREDAYDLAYAVKGGPKTAIKPKRYRGNDRDKHRSGNVNPQDCGWLNI